MIRALRLKNWMSHRDTEIQFKGNKILLIGPNGSGKTSLIEGIIFCLLGDTKGSYRSITNANRKMFIRDGQDRAELQLEFQHNGKLYLIERYVSSSQKAYLYEISNKKILIADGPNAVNDKIRQMIGINSEIFSNIMYSPQENVSRIVELTPSELKSYFDKTLGIEKKSELLKAVDDLIRYLEKTIVVVDLSSKTSLENDIANRKKELDNIEKEIEFISNFINDSMHTKSKLELEIKEYKEKMARYERIKDILNSKIAEANMLNNQPVEIDNKMIETLEYYKQKIVELRNLQIEWSKYEVKIKQIQSRKDELIKEITFLESEIKNLEETVKQYPVLLQEYENLKNEYMSKKVRMEERKKHLNMLNGDRCPVCGSIITEQVKQNIMNELKNINLEEMQNKLKVLETKLMNLESLKRKYDLSSHLLISKKNEMNKIESEKIEKPNISKDDLDKQLKDVEQNIKILEKEIEELKKKEKEYQRFLKLNSEIDQIKKELENLNFNFDIIVDLEKKLSSLISEIKGKKDLLDNKIYSRNVLKQHLSSMESKYLEIVKQIDINEKKQKLLQELKNIKQKIAEDIKNTRQYAIFSLQNSLPSIWHNLYPYSIYSNPTVKVVDDGYKIILYTGKREADVERLSGGEKTILSLAIRLALAKSFNLNILILDEPTYGMDQESIQSLKEVLSNFSFNMQLIFVTHEQDLKEAQWDQIIELKRSAGDEMSYSVI
jgi:DNA repair protein SbcC/Rad50